MWQSPIWVGLLGWCQGDPDFRRELLIRRAARDEIREMLQLDRLSGLTAGEFIRRVATPGCLRHPDGSPVEAEELAAIRPDRLKELLAGSRLVVTGNPLLVSADGPTQPALPGLDAEALTLLRASLTNLLSDPTAAPAEAIERAADDGGPLTRELASQVFCLCCRYPHAIRDQGRLTGLQRLGLLLGAGLRWARVEDSYERFDEAFAELRRYSQGGLRDPLAADLLLCRLARMREPRAWKVAVGLNESRAEAEEVARICLEGGFAAISPDDPGDLNIARLRALIPGDCIVMHLRGRIGAIGRVTRPYYEIDRAEVGLLERRWWRRIGVEWITGDRDYGSLLSGAQQRFSVIELDWECFRAIARMYRRDPAYDRLFRPLHGSWLVLCDEERFRSLSGVHKPLPLRDQISLALGERKPSPGDTIFLYHDGSPCGVFGAATVTSDPHQTGRERSGSYRVDLIYEALRDRPIGTRTMKRDPRLEKCRAPLEPVTHLPPDCTAALMELLELGGRRHFVLIAGGCSGSILRPLESYVVGERTSHAGGGRLAQVMQSGGLARCLIYHGSPENAFAGFGTVVQLLPGEATRRDTDAATEGDGCFEVRLETCRFGRKAATLSARAPAETIGASRRRDPTTRTILPIAEDDFYRVVCAGMAGRPSSADGPLSLEALADESGAPLARLQEMERLVRGKGQMVLYGPPGTGKTWLALGLARYLAGDDPDRQETVQFHPAYSYEDFIEGIRPRAIHGPDGATAVDYPLVRGSFAAFCDRALRDPLNPYAFVIDEINRAQIAAVFGELMLALEYRGREVRLAHSRGPDDAGISSSLIVPSNVLLLATMNTADRSTALVDHALRRRFAFYPLFPDDADLARPIFESWLAKHAPEAKWVAGLLADLNEWLEPEVGRHLLIGHSYFMRPGLSEELVREIWRFQIAPLLEEYFAGVPERLAELEIDELIWRARQREEHRSSGAPAAAEAHTAEGRLWWGGGEDG